MKTDIQNIITRLKPYRDRVLCCPLTTEQIMDLEVKLNISFPDSFREFLALVGIFQDLCPELLETQADFEFEREFILRTTKTKPEMYFAFARDGYGNLQLLKDRMFQEEIIFKLSHASGRVRATKVTFLQFVDKAVTKTIKRYKKLKLNTEKKWCVQFAFQCRSEIEVFETLQKHFTLERIDSPWSSPDISPAEVTKRSMKFVLDGIICILEKLEHNSWPSPNFFFNMEEPVLQVQKYSRITKLHETLTASRLDYKLVNYGIL